MYQRSWFVRSPTSLVSFVFVGRKRHEGLVLAGGCGKEVYVKLGDWKDDAVDEVPEGEELSNGAGERHWYLVGWLITDCMQYRRATGGEVLGYDCFGA